MKNIERAKIDYLIELRKEYEYWKNIDEEHKKGINDTTIAYERMNAIAEKIDNFEESYAKMVDQEAKKLATGIITRIREGRDAFGGAITKRDDGTYTSLGISPNDSFLSSFVKYVQSVGGYVSEEKINNFINQVNSNFVGFSDKSSDLDQMLLETKSGIHAETTSVTK